jgi:ATP-dependent exoDNAse (exonuclease V) beta subunit
MGEKEEIQLLERLLKNYGFIDIISTSELLLAIREFYKWLSKRSYSTPYKKEYPLMVEKGSQLLTGVCDFVVEGHDEILLIDYKTFPGHPDLEKNRESCEWKARSYSGQLVLYKEMLEKVWPGKKVKTLIWFIIAGSIVSVES